MAGSYQILPERFLQHQGFLKLGQLFFFLLLNLHQPFTLHLILLSFPYPFCPFLGLDLLYVPVILLFHLFFALQLGLQQLGLSLPSQGYSLLELFLLLMLNRVRSTYL